MKTKPISSEEAYQAVKVFMSDGEKRSYSELSNFLKENFDANSNQISGLIFRMHKSKKILKKLKNEPTYYIAYDNVSATLELGDDVEALLKKFRKTLVSESLDNDAPLENIKLLREIISDLEPLHNKIQKYNENF